MYVTTTSTTTFPGVLVVAPVATIDEIGDATAFAFDVCDQLGRPATVATSMDFDVRRYSAVVTYGDFMGNVAACVLWSEALTAGVLVVESQPLAESAPCDACRQVQTVCTIRNEHGEVFCEDCVGNTPGCAWCFEDAVTEPVSDGKGTWHPLCHPCAVQARKASRVHATARTTVAA